MPRATKRMIEEPAELELELELEAKRIKAVELWENRMDFTVALMERMDPIVATMEWVDAHDDSAKRIRLMSGVWDSALVAARIAPAKVVDVDAVIKHLDKFLAEHGDGWLGPLLAATPFKKFRRPAPMLAWILAQRPSTDLIGHVAEILVHEILHKQPTSFKDPREAWHSFIPRVYAAFMKSRSHGAAYTAFLWYNINEMVEGLAAVPTRVSEHILTELLIPAMANDPAAIEAFLDSRFCEVLIGRMIGNRAASACWKLLNFFEDPKYKTRAARKLVRGGCNLRRYPRIMDILAGDD